MSLPKASGLRLRRIIFKDGRTIDVLRPKNESHAKDLKNSAQHAGECFPDMAGWALIAWTPKGDVFVNYANGQRSPVPGGGVPQYAKDVLLAECAVRWAKE